MSKEFDPGAVHYKQAEDTLDGITFTHEAHICVSYAEFAQAEATLALAYEQRTANLIAYSRAIDDTDLNVINAIKERLDLA